MTHAGLWLACLLWGISFIASKVALESCPPLTVAMLRLVVSAACFGAWFCARGWPRRAWEPARLGSILILSLFGTSLHYGTQTAGLQYTSASNASLYAVTCPIAIALIAASFLRERLSNRRILGILIALAGVLTAMGWQTLASVDLRSHLWGDSLVFVSIVLWALFTVYGRKLTAELGSLELTGVVTMVGAATMVPVGWVELSLLGRGLGAVTLRSWLAVGFLGVTCSFLATLLYFRALEKTESQKVGVYLYTIPLITYAAAWLLLNETVGWNLAAGSVLVLAGVHLTERN
ncbi:MAG: DMT family transporter [Elusimicrobiota bacterium]|jgi:drug/metabolite transporter (DMT)-like permease